MNTKLLRTLCAFVLMVLAWNTSQAQSLPDGWTASDIGAVGAAGATLNAGDKSFTVDGAGADVWGSADALHYLNSTLTGNGAIVARVTAIEAVHAWTKAGVMMRESNAVGAKQAFMLVSPGKGRAFQRRVTTAGLSTHTGVTGLAPSWVKLEQNGNVFTASVSADGAAWTVVGTETIAMADTIQIGLGVSSHIAGVLATASFDSVTVTGNSPANPPPPDPTALPSGWSTADVGAVGIEGKGARDLGGQFVLEGGGADVWGTADAFRYVYTQLTGDGSIVTQVTSLQNINAWTKGGVMMREALEPGSRQAFMLVSPGKGLAFQRRLAPGGDSTHTSGGAGTAPAWLNLTRAGSTFTAARSVDGVTWTTVGSSSIAMGPTIYVGVAVSSHVAGTLATAAFASTAVTIAPPAPAPVPPPPTTTSAASTQLRVLHWNTHHGGVGTDGVYNPARIADWIAQINPDVISLNEVDNTTQMNAIVNALTTKTGTTWTKSFAGVGNLVLSKLPVSTTSRCVYPDGVRYAAHLTAQVNGRSINIWSTHLTVDSASARLAESISLQTCALNWAEARILAGDYNMQAGTAEYLQSVIGYSDAWKVAKAAGTATNYSGNCDGCTRNSRIDYVFTSTGASFLTLESARIFDTRDANGVMPSDHKPMLVIYNVN